MVRSRRAPPTDRALRRALPLLFVLSMLCAAHAQSRIPDRDTVAAIRQLAQAGDTAQAEARLNAFDAASPLVMYLRGLARYHADDHAGAIDLLTAALPKLDADTLERREAEQVLGLAHYALGHLKAAVPYLEATRAWASDNVELHYFLGLAYLQTGKIDEARRTLAVTFGVPPGGASAHLI